MIPRSSLLLISMTVKMMVQTWKTRISTKSEISILTLEISQAPRMVIKPRLRRRARRRARTKPKKKIQKMSKRKPSKR